MSEVLEARLQRLWNVHQRRHDGYEWVSCSIVAEWLKTCVGRPAMVVGYFHHNNPTAKIGEVEGGHDFLLVEERYLVDFWQRDIWDPEHPLLIDLFTENPYTQLYGDVLLWAPTDVSEHVKLSLFKLDFEEWRTRYAGHAADRQEQSTLASQDRQSQEVSLSQGLQRRDADA